MTRALLALVAAGAAAACGGGDTASPVFVPERAATAGDRLLARLPPGAQVVVEIDLARLRANPVVGAAIGETLAAGPAVPGAPAALAAPLADAATVILVAYRVGTPEAATITMVSGGTRPDIGLDLGDGVWALAPEGETAALVLAAGGGPSLATDARLLAVRAWAMPAAADGASLRLTAVLDATAQASLAGALGLTAAPAAVSLWGDVADDLAVVALLADEQPTVVRAARPAWLRGITRMIQRVARSDEIRTVGLSRSIAEADLRREAGGVRLALIVGPGRLARAVERFRANRGVAPL